MLWTAPVVAETRSVPQLARMFSATMASTIRSLWRTANEQAFRAHMVWLASAAVAFLLSGSRDHGAPFTNFTALSFSGGPVEIDDIVGVEAKREKKSKRFMVINELGLYEDYEHFMKDGSCWWQNK